jgi:hypothetical protein
MEGFHVEIWSITINVSGLAEHTLRMSVSLC